MSESTSKLPAILQPWVSWRRKRFWAVMALVAYTLIGFFAVPWFVERQAVNEMAAVGRTLTADDVKVNPFLLTIEVFDFELRDEDDTVILAYDHYLWDFEASSLFRWAWTFREIRIDGLFVNEERFAGLDTRYHQLLQAFTADTAATGNGAGENKASGLPRIIIQHFQMTDGQFHFTDRSAGDFEGQFGPINVEVNDLRTLPDHTGQTAISIDTSEGGHIQWRGEVGFQPLRSTGHLTISGRGHADAFRYANHFLPFTASADHVQIDFDYQFDLAEGGPELIVSNLAASVQGPALTRDADGQEVLGVNKVELAGGEVRWPAQTASIDSITVTEPHINVRLDAQRRPDLLDLLPPGDGSPPDPDAAWTISLARFDIENGSANVEDGGLNPPVPHGVNGVNVSVTGLDNQNGTNMPVELALNLESGGTVQFNGQAIALPALDVSGRLELGAVELAVAQPYIDPFVRVTLQGGSLDLSADLVSNPEQLASLEGGLKVDGLEVIDGLQGERLAAWQQLRLDRFELDLTGNQVQTSEVEIDELYGRLHIAEDRSTNIADLLIPQPESGESRPLPAITIGGIQLANTSLDFSDFSLPLPFEAAIRSMDGTITTLSTTSEAPANVELEGQVNEFGLARINGDLNAWDPTQQADVRLEFRNLEMSRLTPYTIQFAGYAIDDGRLDVDLGYRLENRQLNGDNKVVISDIVLGEKSDHPDAGNLPLGLAVALLTDAEGVIDLELPVEGDLDDPEFKISGVVWQAIGNIITKAVTAPFRLLGSLVGVDSEDFGSLYFQPGSIEVSPPDQEKLVKLGEAMQQRPGLSLEVGGVWNTAQDSRALQERKANELIEAREAEMGQAEDVLSTELRRSALEALLTETEPGLDLTALQAQFTSQPSEDEDAEPVLDGPAYSAALLERFVAVQDVSSEELVALANERANAVLALLVGEGGESALNASLTEPSEAEEVADEGIVLELAVNVDEAAAE